MPYRGRTLLLVEDEAIIALSCEETLRRQGYEVIVAFSGDDAIEKVNSSERVDLILMDIDLGPGMDGTKAAEIILREHDLPVLFLSSHTESEIVNRTEKITSYGYVVKNSGNTVLFASIKMAFRLYEAHQKLKQREELLVESLREREKTAEALRESEAQLRTLVNSMPDIVSLKDGEGRWIEANDYNLRLFGLEGVDYRGRTDYDLAGYSPKYRDAFIACADSDEKAWAAGSMYMVEETVPQQGGPDLVFDVIKVPTYHSDGRRKELVVIARDITQIKRIEIKLRSQRDEYQTIFDSVPSIIWYVDRAGTILRANRVAVSAVGLAARQLIGMSIYDLFPSHEAEKFIADNLEVISKGEKKLGIIERYTPPSGETRWAQTDKIPYFDENGDIVGVIVVVQDITERQLAEEAVRERERMLRSIATSARDAVIMIDNRGDISFWNEAAFRILGYSAGEALGRNCHELLAPPRYIDQYRKQFPKFQATGEGPAVGKTQELSALRKDGIEVPVELSLSSVKIKGEWCAVGIIRDITERKRFEEALARAVDEKEALLRDLQHRIKNSFAMMSGLMGLELNRQTDAAFSEVLRRLKGRIMSMADLYDLLYRAGEFNEIRLDRYLDRLIKSLIEAYGQDNKKIDIRFRLDSVSIDVRRAIPVGLIINEVITNSIKHAFPGDRGGVVWIRLERGESRIVLTISDDGVGLPRNFHAEQSSGLGARLVNMLVAQVNGTLEVSSENGTRFVITVPVKDERSRG